MGFFRRFGTCGALVVALSEQYGFDVPMPGETFVAPAAKIRRFLRGSGLEGLVPAEEAGANAEVASAR